MTIDPVDKRSGEAGRHDARLDGLLWRCNSPPTVRAKKFSRGTLPVANQAGLDGAHGYAWRPALR
jgi:hypothetical protein